MMYKDKTFEIDSEKIKFNNASVIVGIGPFFTSGLISAFLFYSLSPSRIGTALGFFIASLIGAVLGFLITFGFFFHLYWKNTISFSDIDFVKAQKWDSEIDKNRNFWGIGKYRYHFPTGINKKINPQVIFVHMKGKKLAVGFVPENMENVISILKKRSIRVVEVTS